MQREEGKVGVPLNLQFFAEPGGEGSGTGDGAGTGTQQNNQNNQQQTNQQTPPQVDYERLASLVTGKLTVTEESVLKGYFKQQGMSKEEMDQAIASYKEQKAKNQPDVGALQTQVNQAQQLAQQAMIERDSYLLASELGVDTKTMPYILKMADMKDVVGEDGKVAQDKLKEAINKVLEALPQLKQQASQQAAGFTIGASGGAQTKTAVEEQLDNIFKIKK